MTVSCRKRDVPRHGRDRYRRSVGEEVLQYVDSVGDIHAFVVVGVRRVRAEDVRTLREEVLEDVDPVGDVHGAVTVRIAAPELDLEHAGKPVPRLSENWYCCAEPTCEQLASF